MPKAKEKKVVKEQPTKEIKNDRSKQIKSKIVNIGGEDKMEVVHQDGTKHQFAL